MKECIELIQSDITKLHVDAIVNAANSSLLGGGGVDGAIHRAAGPQLVSECRTLDGCATGEAKISGGYQLPARYVIHTVGPVYGRDPSNQAQLLKQCYLNSLQLAVDHQCKTIAFPNISTGVYGYPKNEAAEVAITAVREFLSKNNALEKVCFVCFGQENFDIYKALLGH
jgi:O-acetyl-ADP-ribose deacetylase (regulator of RNase III)